MKKRIIIKVGKDGNYTVQPQDHQGSSCVNLTKPVEELLGEAQEREYLPEYAIEVGQQLETTELEFQL